MNTHDIELPPLPDDLSDLHDFHRGRIRYYARQAIALDRQGRGEPEGGLVTRESALAALEYVSDKTNGHGRWSRCIKMLETPQSANPVVKDSLTVAEPVKGEIMEQAVHAYLLAEQGCYEQYARKSMVISPDIAVEVGLLAALPFLANRGGAQTGMKSTETRADTGLGGGAQTPEEEAWAKLERRQIHGWDSP